MNSLKKQNSYMIIALSIIYINIIFILYAFTKCYLIKDFDYIYISLIIFVCFILYIIFIHLSKNKKLILLLIIAAVCTEIIYKHVINIQNNIINSSNILFQGISTYSPTYFKQYKIFIILFLPPLVFLIIFLYNKGIRSCIEFLNIITMATLWSIGYSEDIAEIIPVSMFILVLSFGINSGIKGYCTSIKKKTKIHYNLSRGIKYAAAYALIIAIIASIFPFDIDGKKDNINAAIKQEIVYYTNSKDIDDKYDMSMSGYKDSGEKLGGPVYLSGETAFRVKSNNTYYLRGTVRDYYDGFSWKKSKESFEKSATDEKNDNTDISNINGNEKMTIYPENLKTSTMFTPLNTYMVEPQNGKIFSDNDNVYINSRTLNKAYNISFLFETSLGSGSIPEKGTYMVEYKKGKDSNLNIIYSSSAEYSNTSNKYKNYLQLPNNIPDRVYDLVHKITKGCTTYAQRAEKIRNYLLDNFIYDTNVSTVPDGAEFVDNFLFSKDKKGYCVYFATAMTVMCRIDGIPARYVEGYKMKDYKDKSGLYVVTDRDAHAWCEILYNPDKNIWCTAEATSSRTLENTQQVNSSKSASQSQENKEKQANKKNSANINTNNKGLFSMLPFRIFIILIIVAATIAILLNIVYKIRMKNIMKARSNIPFYTYVMKRLNSIGIKAPLNKGELEYWGSYFDDELKAYMLPIVSACYEEYYGGKKKKAIDRKSCYSYIEKRVRFIHGRFKYKISKYLFFMK